LVGSVSPWCDNGGVETLFVLASGSPRRSQLLADAGFEFVVDAPDVDETPLAEESPEEMVVRLACSKALEVVSRRPPGACVLACDTTVVLDDGVLGKPEDQDAAVAMLLRIGGRAHTVVSGYAIAVSGDGSDGTSGSVRSEVVMAAIDRAAAAAYVATGEPLDKAGSYAIQGIGRKLVARYDGSFSNIMGLPMEVVIPELARFGVTPSAAPGPSPG
jgi:septum formation protein